jgi:ABC-type Mn2+/Zn2+ transport system ATPase subunit
LAAFGLEALAGRPIAALSGGEQQRVLLARVLCQQADVLLLDEPFNGLDHNSRADLAQLLLDLVATGKAVVLSHHGVLPELLQQLPGEVDARGPVDHLTLSNGRLC